MPRQLLYDSHWHTLLRKISDELPATWVTRSIDTDIWIERLEQYLKRLWRELSTSALRVDQGWFKRHKTLCVALKILLNLFLHEFWQIDTVSAVSLRHVLSQKYRILDITLTIYDITDFERRYLTRSESNIVWKYDYKTISCWVMRVVLNSRFTCSSLSTGACFILIAPFVSEMSVMYWKLWWNSTKIHNKNQPKYLIYMTFYTILISLRFLQHVWEFVKAYITDIHLSLFRTSSRASI